MVRWTCILATDTYATAEKLLEAVSSVWSILRLYSENHWEELTSEQREMAADVMNCSSEFWEGNQSAMT